MSSALFSQVTGRRVVATDTAETIGSVKGFVPDRAGRTTEAITSTGTASAQSSSHGRPSTRSVPTL